MQMVARDTHGYFTGSEPVLNRLQELYKGHVLRHPATFAVPQMYPTALLPYRSVYKRQLTSAFIQMMDFGLIQEVVKRNMYPYKQHPMLSERQNVQMTLKHFGSVLAVVAVGIGIANAVYWRRRLRLCTCCQ